MNQAFSNDNTHNKNGINKNNTNENIINNNTDIIINTINNAGYLYFNKK